MVATDHQSDPQKGRAEAERLLTKDKVSALLGIYQSAVAATISQTAERYGVPLRRGGQLVAQPVPPRTEILLPPERPGRDVLGRHVRLPGCPEKKGQKIETLALFYEDTIFGSDSSAVQRRLAGDRGYKILADIKYRANSPSLTAEVQQIKSANIDVLLPTSYTTDGILLVKTMAELGYAPKAILAQDAGFSEKALYDAVGDRIIGALTRGSFSLDLAASVRRSARSTPSSRRAPARISATRPRAS